MSNKIIPMSHKPLRKYTVNWFEVEFDVPIVTGQHSYPSVLPVAFIVCVEVGFDGRQHITEVIEDKNTQYLSRDEVGYFQEQINSRFKPSIES
jgi:hypothetical protein